jgi:hypothetical protein
VGQNNLQMTELIYYKLDFSAVSLEIGVVPQISGFNKINSTNSTFELEEFACYKGKMYNSIPDLRNYKLDKKAKLTDLISCGLCPGGDFLVSEKLKNIIELSKYSSSQFFPASIETKKKEIYNYYLIHFNYSLEELIDFKQTEYNYNIYPQLKNNKFNSFQEYQKFKKEVDKHGYLQATKLVLNSNFNTNLDFFVLSWIDQNLCISKKLKDIIIKEKITGIKISEKILFISS